MVLDVFTLFPGWFDWFREQRHVRNAEALGHGLQTIDLRATTPLSAGQERTTDVLHDLPVEHAGPELRQASRVVRIEGHRQQSREHHRTVDTGRQDNKATEPGRP